MIVSTLQNFVPFVPPERKGIPLVYLLLLCSPPSLSHLFLFLSPYCQLDKTGGRIKRRKRGGEDYANRPIIICAQLVGAQTICSLNGRSWLSLMETSLKQDVSTVGSQFAPLNNGPAPRGRYKPPDHFPPFETAASRYLQSGETAKITRSKRTWSILADELQSASTNYPLSNVSPSLPLPFTPLLCRSLERASFEICKYAPFDAHNSRYTISRRGGGGRVRRIERCNSRRMAHRPEIRIAVRPRVVAISSVRVTLGPRFLGLGERNVQSGRRCG